MGLSFSNQFELKIVNYWEKLKYKCSNQYQLNCKSTEFKT